jgi:hypothetical protein
LVIDISALGKSDGINAVTVSKNKKDIFLKLIQKV